MVKIRRPYQQSVIHTQKFNFGEPPDIILFVSSIPDEIFRTDGRFNVPELRQQRRAINAEDRRRLVPYDIFIVSDVAERISGSSGKRVGESDGECGLKAYGYWVFGVS